MLSNDCAAASIVKGRSFEVGSVNNGLVITARPFGATMPDDDRMTFPGWRWVDPRLMCATPDGRWLLVVQSTPRQEQVGVLAAIDWEQKKIVREIPISWNATTMEFSADGSRLLVGASNRSIYEFDVKQLCTTP